MVDEKKKSDNKDLPGMGLEAANIATATDVNLQDPPMRIPGIRLNVGSGIDSKEGFINIDPFDAHADMRAFAHELPFADDSVAQIVCYQTLEHLPQAQVQHVLTEFARVLKKEGNIVCTVPDMVGACERFLEDPENDWSLARIYGHQAHEGQYHKAGFTPKRLFKLCGYAGFRLVEIAYFSEGNGVRDLYLQAVK